MKIKINEKEYESGKITRSKYGLYRKVYESLSEKDTAGQVFDDCDLDNMIQAIVDVYDNQFTFEEACDALDEVADVIFNFSLINTEILEKTNSLAKEKAKTKKTNTITIKGKEYECGKITRKKYKTFRDTYSKLMREDKETYTDCEFDNMIQTIVDVYDNQFTFEEACTELEDVSQIIFNFALINANIIQSVANKSNDAKKNLN